MLLINTAIGSIMVLTLFYKKSEIYKFYSISDCIFNKHKSRAITVLFKTVFLFTLINLIASLIGANNYIQYSNNVIPFYYLLSFMNTIIFIIIGVIKNGPIRVLNSLCPIKANSIKLLPITIIVTLMNFISHFIITPAVLPTRLLINHTVGELMHSEISRLQFGLPILLIINFLKIVIYFIQSYVFYLFSEEIYERACKVK